MGGPDEAEPLASPAGIDSEDDIDDGFESDAPQNLTEKRRAQNAIFDAWIVSDATQEVLKSESTSVQAAAVVDEHQSINSLLVQQKEREIVKNPRQYQTELFDRAKNENTIAVLDTGSGKTLIAVLLLRWVIDIELENRAMGKPPKIAVFLVNSVTLAYQQYLVLESNLDHSVARVCGADGVDNWKKSRWDDLFANNKIIVCTADILLQCLSRSYISMKQINLLVFDEAHHTKKNHAYARFLVPRP